MVNYGKLAFSGEAKALQEQYGSRHIYEQVEKRRVLDGLSENEQLFIAQQDHFYIASIGENGYPYIQHRGGPEGFVKVLNDRTLAFVDFSGNKQYITTGNIENNPHVSLIMVSYSHSARLKLYAKIKVVELQDDPTLFATLDPSDYKHRPERMMVLDIVAYDWNCPQHITPRYTTGEIEEVFESHRQLIAGMEEENKKLKIEIGNLKKNDNNKSLHL